jgi:hypothetical protein
MTTLDHTAVNRTKVTMAERALAELLAQSLVRGFHGTAAIELSVQDGTIQHIRRKVDRIEK